MKFKKVMVNEFVLKKDIFFFYYPVYLIKIFICFFRIIQPLDFDRFFSVFFSFFLSKLIIVVKEKNLIKKF